MFTVCTPIIVLKSLNNWPFSGFFRPSAIIDFVEMYPILIRPDSTTSRIQCHLIPCLCVRESLLELIFLCLQADQFLTPQNSCLSSCEAEYMALVEPAKEAVWCARFLAELGYCKEKPLSSCEQITKDRFPCQRTPNFTCL